MLQADAFEVLFMNELMNFQENLLDRNVVILLISSFLNRIGGVMVSVLSSSAVDRVFEHGLGQIKDYTIGRKSKYWLARNQDNVSEWCNMYIHVLLFQ